MSEYVTARRAARILGVTVEKVYRLVKKGMLPAVKWYGIWIVYMPAVVEYGMWTRRRPEKYRHVVECVVEGEHLQGGVREVIR
ncbi:MAG: hypothetical protein QXD59_08560 [Candidatus Caldarchaeum sp.]